MSMSEFKSFSPVFDDYCLVVKETKDGNVVVNQKIDYAQIIERNGSVNAWSLNAMLAAGVDPASFHVSTGYNSRLEGVNDLNTIVSDVDEFFNSQKEVPAGDNKDVSK